MEGEEDEDSPWAAGYQPSEDELEDEVEDEGEDDSSGKIKNQLDPTPAPTAPSVVAAGSMTEDEFDEL
jgi:hypothetical protein